MSMAHSAAAPAGKFRPWMPDFFIVGAMKCGTTTLHAMLERHPGIFVAPGEVFFFDIDDFLEHPDFFAWDGAAWHTYDFERRFEEYLPWYGRHFAGAQPGQLIGEDSTTYLASELAAARIARFNPDARIIAMLRDPATRTYSNYWHLLRNGRLLHGFEDSLRLQPESLVGRSLYKVQLERYLRHFPRNQVHVILLEELTADPAGVLRECCGFLGLPAAVPEDALALHRNPGSTPRSLRVQVWRNRLLWRREAVRYLHRLPGWQPPAPGWRDAPLRLLDRVHRRLNHRRGPPPPMRAPTRRFLNALFRRENQGLDTLIGKDLDRWWYRDGKP